MPGDLATGPHRDSYRQTAAPSRAIRAEREREGRAPPLAYREDSWPSELSCEDAPCGWRAGMLVPLGGPDAGTAAPDTLYNKTAISVETPA